MLGLQIVPTTNLQQYCFVFPIGVVRYITFGAVKNKYNIKNTAVVG
jgi:hypothetical protein